jgi:hypothetical protein
MQTVRDVPLHAFDSKVNCQLGRMDDRYSGTRWFRRLQVACPVPKVRDGGVGAGEGAAGNWGGGMH